jgi:hypothetical protein
MSWVFHFRFVRLGYADDVQRQHLRARKSRNGRPVLLAGLLLESAMKSAGQLENPHPLVKWKLWVAHFVGYEGVE